MTAVVDRSAETAAGPLWPSTETDDRRREPRRLRHRLLAWSALPVLALTALAGVLLFNAVAIDRGIDAYRTDDHGNAAEWFDRAAAINIYERELPAFDRGDALVAAGDLAGARLAFEEALGLADGERRCVVVVNLVLTVELQGDAVVATDPGGARQFYAEADDLVRVNDNCLPLTTDAGDGPGDRLARALERLEDKLEDDEVENLPQAEAEESVGPEADPNQDDVDELERRLEENAETRTQGEEINESLDRGLPPQDGPSW